jgi:hypothetical protein
MNNLQQAVTYTTQVWKRNNHNNRYDIDYVTTSGCEAFDIAKRRLGADITDSDVDYPDFYAELLSQADEDSDLELVDHFYTSNDVF